MKNMATALVFQLTSGFGACVLLAILSCETTICIDDTLSSKPGAAAVPVAYAQTTDNTNSTTSSNSEDLDAAEFAVNFLASPMDGSKPHIHQITAFRPYDNSGEPIALTKDYSLSVNGTADIKINGVPVWEDADVSISISKGNIFTFDPDDLDTEDHFGDQQVYGIVTGLFS
jgi:hypothetical protein